MKRRIPRETGVGIAFVVVFALFSILSPKFASPANLLTAARQYAEVALVSIGMTYVILIGGIDLSVGSIAGLAGMLAGWFALRSSSPCLAGFLVAIGAGIVLGLFNGSLIGLLKLSPVIVTLATWAGARSLAYALTHGDPLGDLPDSFVAVGDLWVFGVVPLTALLALIGAVIASVALRKTAYGRSLIALGRNEKSALFSGIAVGKLGLSVYLLAGALAGLAGALMASRAATSVPDAGMGLEFDAITAVALGGAKISGGYASIVGTMLGVATLGLLHNGCNLLGYDSTWQTLAVGSLLILSVALDARLRAGSRD